MNESLFRESSIELNAIIDVVFPLFEPMNEKLWVKGWDPEIVFPADGRMQEKMIFRTPPRFQGEDSYVWTVIHYDPDKHLVKYLVSARERIWFITVQCVEQGAKTIATISYEYIALTANGYQRNQEAFRMMFSENLKDWEEAINNYLQSLQ